MKILVVSTQNDRSDVEVYRLMALRGNQVHVVSHPQWQGGTALTEAGASTSTLAIRHRLDFKAAAAIRRLVLQMAPDVIYAPRNSSLSVTLLATRGMTIPVVAYRGTTGHLSRWDPAAWLSYLHPRLANIVCVSEAVRQYLLEMRLPASRLSTIYKGHRVAWYTGTQAASLAEFGVPPNAVTVGFIGNIRPVKGVDVLLRSLAFIPEELNVHICLIGEVRDRTVEALCQRPEIASRVHLAGYQPGAARYCGGFDVFVMPSVEREGLPRAAIEAMARRVPTIVSRAGGMPELVEDGVSGIVVPPRDPRRLAEAITTLARSPALRKQYGESAQQRIETRFNVDQTADQMLALFAHLRADSAND